MKMILMGTGTSHGVPVIGCTCKVCQSQDKRDKRYRCSAYIENENSSGSQHSTTNIVIDTGPEFRIQALETHITRLDGVLITHSHADHCHGLDDIRIFSHTRPAQTSDGTDITKLGESELQKLSPNYQLETVGDGIPIYSNEIATEDLYRKFDYVFHPRAFGGGLPKLNLQNCEEYTPSNELTIGSIKIFSVPIMHGKLPDSGWVLHSENSKSAIAYLTDCNFISDESIDMIKNSGLHIEHLIIDALRIGSHSTHCSFDNALAYAERILPTHTWFTHMTHDLLHTEIQEYIDEHLPAYIELKKIVEKGGSVAPAFDGLVLNV